MKQPLSKDVSKYVQTIKKKLLRETITHKPLRHNWCTFSGFHEVIDVRRPAAKEILASSVLNCLKIQP